MAELILEKAPGNVLVPAEPQGIQMLESWRLGAGIRCEVTKIRNYAFHKKFFAMLNTAFALWEPPRCEWSGIQAEKDFDTFREQVTITAGFHYVVVDIRGNARVRPKSISFASMDDDEFARVYRAVFNVCWKILLNQSAHWTPALLENAIANLESFT
jgi:hypothetical protein